MSESLHLTRNGPILEITLDRPKANAIDAKTSFAMGEAFLNFRDDPELRVAIITGGGEKFFSAGWDLKAAAEGEAPDADFGPGGFAGLTEIFDLDKPVIAAVNGYAFGGGFELALAADFIVCAENASFALPEAKLGIVPDSGGVLRLPKLLPPAIVNEMVMTGRRMSAEEALRWGIVNRVWGGNHFCTDRRRHEFIVKSTTTRPAGNLGILHYAEKNDLKMIFLHWILHSNDFRLNRFKSTFNHCKNS